MGGIVSLVHVRQQRPHLLDALDLTLVLTPEDGPGIDGVKSYGVRIDKNRNGRTGIELAFRWHVRHGLRFVPESEEEWTKRNGEDSKPRDEEARRRALTLSQGLLAAKAAFEGGERQASKLVKAAKALMTGADSIQYLELVDAQTLTPFKGPVDRTVALCVAAYVGSTRLIDNVLLVPPANVAGPSGTPSA